MSQLYNVAVVVGSLRKDSINRKDGTEAFFRTFIEAFSNWIAATARVRQAADCAMAIPPIGEDVPSR